MKKYMLLGLAITIIMGVSSAFASGNELAYKRVRELVELSTGSVASGDVVPILDSSTGKVKKIDATNLPWDGTFDGAIGGTTPAAGAFTTLDASGATTLTTAALTGNLTLDDGVTDSPSITLQDATNETAVFLKTDAGFLGLTTDATDGLNVLVGNLKVGNGTPGLTQDGEDAYIEGTLEVDGATQFDGGVTTAGTLTTTGSISVDSVTINKKILSLPGRLTITICGDGTTINNNTVFYGPSRVPVAGAMRTCDITQAGNVTEATADAPALEGTAFQVLSMDCLTADPGAAGVSFTLRTAAGATVPSVTCTAANTELGCTANIATTVEIASGATIAIAAASSGDQGATSFACTIHAAY